MNTHEIIKILRKEKGLTQDQLGQIIGVSKNMICMYEKGKRIPGRSAIMKMADIFQVSADFILGRTIEKKQKGFMLNEELSPFRELPAVPVYASSASFSDDAPETYAREEDLLANNRLDNMIYLKLKESDEWLLVDQDNVNANKLCVMSNGEFVIKNKEDVRDTDQIVGQAVSITRLL